MSDEDEDAAFNAWMARLDEERSRAEAKLDEIEARIELSKKARHECGNTTEVQATGQVPRSGRAGG